MGEMDVVIVPSGGAENLGLRRLHRSPCRTGAEGFHGKTVYRSVGRPGEPPKAGAATRGLTMGPLQLWTRAAHCSPGGRERGPRTPGPRTPGPHSPVVQLKPEEGAAHYSASGGEFGPRDRHRRTVWPLAFESFHSSFLSSVPSPKKVTPGFRLMAPPTPLLGLSSVNPRIPPQPDPGGSRKQPQ